MQTCLHDSVFYYAKLTYFYVFVINILSHAKITAQLKRDKPHMKYYAVIKDGKISAHKLLYTNKESAEYELKAMLQLPHKQTTLQGATVAEVKIEIVK
jgi:hypothetical protein